MGCATWKFTRRSWVTVRQGLHGLRGPLGLLHKEMKSGIFLGTMIMSATPLAVLLVFGGVGKNSGPGVEAEKVMQVVCSRCNTNLKSGTQCDTCGLWFNTRGADKSLARPGKKQATPTKLRFNSTYSPRSSIDFLARCSDVYKATQ